MGRSVSLQRLVRGWAANAVSLSRIALLFPLAWFEIHHSPWAFTILAAVIASDLVDGPLARRLGTAGSTGALIDSASDVLILMGAGFAIGLTDMRYVGFAAVMAVSFLSYGALSLVIGRFAYTRLGRYSGTVSYCVITTASVRPVLAAIGARVPPAVEWLTLVLSCVFLAAAAAENVVGILAALEGRHQDARG